LEFAVVRRSCSSRIFPFFSASNPSPFLSRLRALRAGYRAKKKMEITGLVFGLGLPQLVTERPALRNGALGGGGGWRLGAAWRCC
jgi:hypothetical protein